MHEYDTVLKALLQGSANLVLEQITGTRVARWLPVELPQVQNPRMDLLGESILAELFHIELQSTNDAQMAVRMAEYMLRAFRLYGRFPKQILLYVGEAPLRMSGELKTSNFSFSFEMIDIRDLDAEKLLDSPWLSDNVIAILGRLKNRREIVRRALLRISQLSGQERAVAFQQLSILAGLRRLGEDVREEARNMPILSDIMDHDLIDPAIRQGIQEGLQQGLQQGIQQGRLEGQREVVRRLIEKRFGPISAPEETRLLGLTAAELEALALRVIEAPTADQLFS